MRSFDILFLQQQIILDLKYLKVVQHDCQMRFPRKGGVPPVTAPIRR